jgi:periplasmic divalent cation tolerance protein
MSVISVYVVFADDDEAERIGRAMVEERLAACINILGPIRSIYRWKGAIETSEEVAAIFKTTGERADTLVTRIAALHSYDVPCVAAWPIANIHGAYADWVEDSVTKTEG